MTFSFIYGFFTGCFLSFLGSYYVKKIASNNRHVDIDKNKKKELKELFEQYSVFMSQIRNDLIDPDSKNIQEFFVLNKNALMNSAIPRLRYELCEENLLVLTKLEHLGFIEKIPNDSLLYKMHEEFIVQIRSIAPC